MELIEKIKVSMLEQSSAQGVSIVKSSNRAYINQSLVWESTKEGNLFWGILNFSYLYWGFYDYISIIKIYHRFGKAVFKHCAYSTLKTIYSENVPINNTLDIESMDTIISILNERFYTTDYQLWNY